MGFVVDKVSEDSFYENILLGVSKILEKSPCVSQLHLQRFPGLRQIDVRNWEHNNGVILPEDIRSFYLSSNGFLYTYKFSYDNSSSDDDSKLTRIGKININPIEYLIPIVDEYEIDKVAKVEKCGRNNYTIVLSKESKVFELVDVEGFGKVVLIYLNSYSIPNVWFYTKKSQTFDYLASDFTTYFRMCIAHVGIPCWQLVVTADGLPGWTREMFQLIAPGVLLGEERNYADACKLTLDTTCLNRIDPNIFASPQQLNILTNNSGLNSTTAISSSVPSQKYHSKINDKKYKSNLSRTNSHLRNKKF